MSCLHSLLTERPGRGTSTPPLIATPTITTPAPLVIVVVLSRLTLLKLLVMLLVSRRASLIVLLMVLLMLLVHLIVVVELLLMRSLIHEHLFRTIVILLLMLLMHLTSTILVWSSLRVAITSSSPIRREGDIVKSIDHSVKVAQTVRWLLLLARPHRIPFCSLWAHWRVMPLHVADGALHLRVCQAIHWILLNDFVQLLLRDSCFLAVSRFVPTLPAIMTDPSLMRIATLVQLPPINPVLLRRKVGQWLKRQVLHRNNIFNMLKVAIRTLRAEA